MGKLILLIIITIGITGFLFLKRRKQVIAKEGQCGLCGQFFLDTQLSLVDGLSLCDKDVDVFKNSKWKSLKQLISDPNNPEASMEIYHLKNELTAKGYPNYILTDYMMDGEIIKSIFTLYVREKDFAKIRQES